MATSIKFDKNKTAEEIFEEAVPQGLFIAKADIIED